LSRPPRLATWLVAVLLPEDLAELVAGDLEEDWQAAALGDATGAWPWARSSRTGWPG
jgi:hypothetical protein